MPNCLIIKTVQACKNCPKLPRHIHIDNQVQEVEKEFVEVLTYNGTFLSTWTKEGVTIIKE